MKSYLTGLHIWNKHEHQPHIYRHMILASCAMYQDMLLPDMVREDLPCSQGAHPSLLIQPKCNPLRFRLYSGKDLTKPRLHRITS